MPRRRGRHVGARAPGKHVAEKAVAVDWFDEDGSFGAALIVATCLGLGIVSVVFSGALLN